MTCRGCFHPSDIIPLYNPKAFDSLEAPAVHRLDSVTYPGRTPSYSFTSVQSSVGTREYNPEHPVTTWWVESVLTTGDLKITVPQQLRRADMMVPGRELHGSPHVKAKLDTGADILSIPESLDSFWELEFPGVPIKSAFAEGPRFM